MQKRWNQKQDLQSATSDRDGDDSVDRLGGSGVEIEGGAANSGGDKEESELDGVTLEITDGGSGMSSADSSGSLSKIEDMVGMLVTLGAGLLRH